MTRPTTPADVVRALVTGVAAKRYAELPALYARATNVTHPFAADAPPLRSRDEIAEHFAAGAASRVGDVDREVVDLEIHETTDPEVVIAEFAYRWLLPDPHRVGAVFVVRVRDREIVESRDYFDAAARARLDELL
jgi:ketosteroid isomerase-like protein